MTQIDNQLLKRVTLEQTQEIEGEINPQHNDHELLLNHVTQQDPELYALDCSICDLFM